MQNPILGAPPSTVPQRTDDDTFGHVTHRTALAWRSLMTGPRVLTPLSLSTAA
jgi:hypothetical protein